MDYSKFNEYCQQLSNKHSDDVDFTKELIDISETTNKRRKWQEYKQSNIYLANAYTQIDDDKAIKLLSCAEYLAYDVDEHEKKTFVASLFLSYSSLSCLCVASFFAFICR